MIFQGTVLASSHFVAGSNSLFLFGIPILMALALGFGVIIFSSFIGSRFLRFLISRR